MVTRRRMSARSSASWPESSASEAKWRLLRTSSSNGQTAQNGTMAANPSFWQITRSPRRNIGQRRIRPNLAMRMRIAGPHQRPAILENLHVLHPIDFPETAKFGSPDANHLANFCQRHAWNRQIMPRREADHPASAALGTRHEQARLIDFKRRNVRQQRCVVVFEDKR